MAGWKLRKDKASAETVDAADAPAQEQEDEPRSESNGSVHFDSPSAVPSFDASGSHFTDLDFDSDPEAPKYEEEYSPLPNFTQHAQVFEMSPAAFDDSPIALGGTPPPFDDAPTAFESSSPAFAVPPPEAEAVPAFEAEPELTPPDEANDFQKLLRTGRFEAGELAPAPESGFGVTEPSVSPFVLDTPPSAAPPPAPPQLIVHFGRLSATFPVTKDVTTIGRPDSALHYYPDVELETDDAVSRRHAEVVKRSDGYYVVDTGSTNGTMLNGESLLPHAEHLLAPGDRIRVGERTEIVFE